MRQERRSCRTRWTPQATRRVLLLPSAGAGSSGCQWPRSCRASRRSPFRREQDQSCLRRCIRMSRREVQPSLRISREGGGSAPRGAGSARAALEFSALRAQRRTPAIRVRKNEVVARHARAAHFESLPATGSARRARGLFTCSTRCRAGAPKSRTARGVLPRACSRAHGVRLNSRLRGQDGLVLEAHLTVRTAKEELLKAGG